MKKLDIKSILILVLIGVCILFFGMWFFKGDNYKSEVKDLEKLNKNIEITRDSLKKANISLKNDYDLRQKSIDERDKKIKDISEQLSKVKTDLISANNKVKQNQKDLDETKKGIEELKKNPIKRDDQELINSLKDKLK